MTKMTPSELAVLSQLDACAASRAGTEAFIALLERLQRDAAVRGEIATEPLDARERTPGDLRSYARSARLVVYPGGVSGRMERHPNSHQRVVGVAGSGIIRVARGKAWQKVRVISHGSLEVRWLSVAPNVWHHPVGGADLRLVTASLAALGRSKISPENFPWKDLGGDWDLGGRDLGGTLANATGACV